MERQVGRIAAVWCRVSTHDQQELSLESQEAAVSQELEAEGYEMPPALVLKVDWTSLDLMACPQFQDLRRWIATRQIQALGVFDRDRLQAQGLQRLVFLSECREAGVEIVAVQGPPMMEGGEGQLVELALALGKEKAVLRAQQGARDGLRDRAVLKGLPPSMAKPYGMRWQDDRLVPDENYPQACEIWRMAMEGFRLRSIATEMTRRGIPTPRGKSVWQQTSLRSILVNRTYAGVVEALKTEAVAPALRRTGSYGRSSSRPRPEAERIRLEGLVAQPIVTEAEFEWIQQRLRDNQRFAARNTRLRDYLLKGLIRCHRCGRGYVGVTRRGHSRYYCKGRWSVPWGADKCSAETFRAEEIEEAVWGTAVQFLKGSEGFLAEAGHRQGLEEQTVNSIECELADLVHEDARERDAEAQAFRYVAHGRVSEDVYEQEVGLIRTRRRWLAEQKEGLEARLADLGRHAIGAEAVTALRDRMEGRLAGATPQDRRFVLEAIGARVLAPGDGTWELELEIPQEETTPEPPNGQTAYTNLGAYGVGRAPAAPFRAAAS